jgi:hypothetical protein
MGSVGRGRRKRRGLRRGMEGRGIGMWVWRRGTSRDGRGKETGGAGGKDGPLS